MSEWYSMEGVVKFLNFVEERGEFERSFKGYGRDAIEFTVKGVSKKEAKEIDIYIDNKLIKSCKNEGEVIDIITKKAEEF